MTVARALGVALGLAACSSGLRTAKVGEHPAVREQIEIREPPPPAKVEAVPPDPGERCVWLDGQWELVGRGWKWTPGGWHIPPPGCSYAPPLLVWAESGERGQLYHTPGRWYPDDGTAPCPEPARCAPATR